MGRPSMIQIEGITCTDVVEDFARNNDAMKYETDDENDEEYEDQRQQVVRRSASVSFDILGRVEKGEHDEWVKVDFDSLEE